MNQEIQITKQPSQRQQQQELPREDVQDHTSRSHVEHQHQRSKLTVLPLVFLVFFEVSGGPYGAERAVRAVGPLFKLLGFLVFPFLWGVPESLVTAELAAALPGNGGFVLWADRAFGPLAGSLLGTWKYLSCVINVAAYPSLAADYLGDKVFSGSSRARTCTVVGMTVALSLLNCTGLSIVGWAAVALGLVSLAPFLIMVGISVPKLRPMRWTVKVVEGKRDWRLFFNTLFWNLNYWDSAKTMAGEVDRPERTFPRALAAAVVLVAASYLLPLMAAIGATDASLEEWNNGYLVDAAGIIGGQWLKYWIQAGAVVSSIGMFEAQLSSGAYQLLGMSERGLLPAIFGTPCVAVAASASVTLAVSFLGFDDVVATANFLYSLGTLLEFAAFLRLRAARPDLKRPYRVPLPLPAMIAVCAVPSAFLAYVCAVAGWRVLAFAGAFTALGVVLHGAMRLCRSRNWFRFNNTALNADDDHVAAGDQISTIDHASLPRF